MTKKSLKNHERALRWEKKEVTKRVDDLLLQKAEAIADTMADAALDGNFQSQAYIMDKLFGKARQNIGLDGGEDGAPIVFMPSALVTKFALDKPVEEKGIPEYVEKSDN